MGARFRWRLSIDVSSCHARGYSPKALSEDYSPSSRLRLSSRCSLRNMTLPKLRKPCPARGIEQRDRVGGDLSSCGSLPPPHPHPQTATTAGLVTYPHRDWRGTGYSLLARNVLCLYAQIVLISFVEGAVSRASLAVSHNYEEQPRWRGRTGLSRSRFA